MVDITIVNGGYFMVYKPTYNWGGHPVPLPYYIAGNGPQCSPMTSHYIPGFTD